MKLKELIDETQNLFYYTTLKDIISRQTELINFFGNIEIKKITSFKIKDFILYLENKNNTAATINAKLSILNKLLNYCLRERLISHKPYIPYRKIKAKKVRFITTEEKDKMYQYCEETNNQTLMQILLLGFYTGMRISNVILFNPETDVEKGYIRIWNNKTNKPYSVPLHPVLKDKISTFTKLDINYNQVYYMFNKMKQELKLDEDITIHTLRHTFCSDLINNNVPVPVIQKLANHSSITTTMSYSHLNNSVLEKAVSLL